MTMRKGDFSQGKVSGNILRLGLPMMLAELVHVLYNIVDRMYIGHMPEGGTIALTGLGICFPLITLIGTFANLFSTGGATLATIARGRQQDEKAERIMNTAFTALLLTGLFLSAVLYLSAPVTLRLLGGDAETLPAALGYFRIYVLGTVPVLISLGMNPFINAQGFPRIGMMTVIIGAALNIVLDPLLIYTAGMSIEGAALATVISQAASALWVLAFLRGKRAPLRLTRFLIDRKELPNNGVVGGGQSVMSYNYGAKEYRRVSECIRFIFYTGLITNIVIWAMILFVPRPLISLFTADGELIAKTIECARIYFGAFPFMALQLTGQTTFVALNRPLNALVFSTLRKVVLVAPLTLLLPGLGLGVDGVFWAEFISQVTGASACFITMYVLIWRKMKENKPLTEK